MADQDDVYCPLPHRLLVMKLLRYYELLVVITAESGRMSAARARLLFQCDMQQSSLQLSTA
jgi:hypothetical protein